jgi:hypothetical protein
MEDTVSRGPGALSRSQSPGRRDRRARACFFAVAIIVSALVVVGSGMSPVGAEPLPAYDGTHTGPRGNRDTYFRYDPTLAFSRADLAATGTTASFTTTIAANIYAANWTTAGALDAVGFLRVIPGEVVGAGTPLASPAHDGDPIAWMQNNLGAGIGGAVCTNDQFFQNGGFVFGIDGQCALPLDNATQAASDPVATLRVTVTIAADGTYTIVMTPLDVDGDPVTSTTNLSFTGTVPGDELTQFVPFVRSRPGADTGGNGVAEPDSDWVTDIGSTDLTAPRATPTATLSAVTCTGVGSGTYTLTTGNTGTAGAYLTTTVDASAEPAKLVAGGTTASTQIPVAAGDTVQVAVAWVGGELVAQTLDPAACTTTDTVPSSGGAAAGGLVAGGTIPATGPNGSGWLVALGVGLIAVGITLRWTSRARPAPSDQSRG